MVNAIADCGTRTSRGLRWKPRALLEALPLAVLLGSQSVVFGQLVSDGADSNYDEGTYLASVDALRHGDRLGDEIFVSQPPGWYYLMTGISIAAGRSVEAHRIGMILLALLGVIAAYVLGRSLAGRLAGLGAAAVIGVAPAYAAFAARVVADVAGLSLALASLALAVMAFDRRKPGLAALAGALLIAAVSVKLYAVTAALPLAGLALSRGATRRAIAAFAAGAGALAVALLATHAGSLADIYRGAVDYHVLATDAPTTPGTEVNVWRLRQFFVDPETMFLWLTLAGAAAFLAAGRVRRTLWPLWLWPPLAAIALVQAQPLHENHYVLGAVAAGLPAGASLGGAISSLRVRFRELAVAVSAAALAVGYAVEGVRLDRAREPDSGAIQWAADALETETAFDELVATDRPIVAFLADRRLPGNLVDTAVLRFTTGTLTSGEVLAEIERHRIDVVFVDRAFALQPGLVSSLERRFPRRRRFGSSVLLMR